jgi:hypothetical protein
MHMTRSLVLRSARRRETLRRFGNVASLLALAASVVATGPAAAGTGEQHCVVRLVPLSAETADGVVTASPRNEGCFSTLEAALEAGTGGDVTLAASVGPQDLTQSLLEISIAGASDVLLGTEYDSINFGGGSTNYFASSGCASTTWQVSNVGSALNDTFESGKGFGTCDHNRKFEHADFGGAVQLCTPNCGTYGTLRNEVTSLRWRD